MAKYKPGKSGVPTRKVKEIKKKISAEKGKTKSDKDRIADLEKQLAILLAKTQQKQDRISDRDVERSLVDFKGQGRFYENALSDEEIARMKRNIKKNRPATRGNYMDAPSNSPKKGGGKVYTSQNKKYGGGIYPKRGK